MGNGGRGRGGGLGRFGGAAGESGENGFGSPDDEDEHENPDGDFPDLEHEGGIDERGGGEVRMRARRFGLGAAVVGGVIGGRRGAIGAFAGGGDGDIHAAVDFAAGLAGAGLAAAEGGVVVEDAVGGDFEKLGVGAQEAAYVDLAQANIEIVALKFLEVLAANLGRFGGLANGDAFLFAGVFEAFTDGLHDGGS